MRNSLSSLVLHSMDSLGHQHRTKKLSPKIALHFKVLCESNDIWKLVSEDFYYTPSKNLRNCVCSITIMGSTIVHKKRLWNVTLFPLRMKNSRSNKIIKNFLSLHTKNSLFTNKTRHIWENSELLKMVLKIVGLNFSTYDKYLTIQYFLCSMHGFVDGHYWRYRMKQRKIPMTNTYIVIS